MELTTLTYNVASGSGQLLVNTIPADVNYISFQASGNASVNGAVTVKLRQSNDASGTYKDVTGATATVNTSTSEFVDGGLVTGVFFEFDIAVGAATTGTLTFIIAYK